MNKLKNIKELLSRNREKEQQRVQKTRKNIEALQKKIEASEKDARKMTRKAERFRKAALKDGLTGLYNRSSFDAQLAESLKSNDHGGEPLFMALFDVDNFKWINDTFGHVAGDKVLKAVAQGLAQRFREDDFIARYGGDEFVVFIIGMNEALVRKRVAAFLSGFSKKRFLWKTEGKSINVSLSAGIAAAEDGDRPEDLIHRADMAMYTAKKNRPPVPAR